MPASPIRRLMPFADAAVQRGVRIFHLNIGQPDIDSPREFWDAIGRVKPDRIEYSHSAGRLSLRTLATEHYQKMGLPVEVDDLMVTTAGSEALQFAMLTCLNPGAAVVLREPCYANYLGFAAEGDLVVNSITTNIEDSYRIPPVSEFERVITPGTRAILICNPDNPTGTVFTRQQMYDLRDLVKARSLYLICDEVYREFNYTGARIPSVLELEGIEDLAIMVDSVSKRFSLCGARIGFLVSKNREVMSYALRFAQARLSAPTLEMIGVEGALNAPQSYFDQVRAEYVRRRDVLIGGLRKINGVTTPDVEGAFYAMVRLPIDDSDRFCRWLLESFVYKGSTVMLSPGTGFYATAGLGLNEVRVAYVLREQELQMALECLREALAVYPGRTCEQTAAAR